jgi:hypothetical protein
MNTAFLLTKAAEETFVPLLRAAGCHCPQPLLGWRPFVGPRCRLCNVEAEGKMELVRFCESAQEMGEAQK